MLAASNGNTASFAPGRRGIVGPPAEPRIVSGPVDRPLASGRQVALARVPRGGLRRDGSGSKT